MSDKTFVFVSLIAAILLLAMLNLVPPSDVGPLGVLVFFTLFYMVCLGVMVLGCRIFFGLRQRIQKRKMVGSTKKSYYYGSILAFAPLMLVFMRSSGELGWMEVGLVIFFVVLSCFYVSKRI